MEEFVSGTCARARDEQKDKRYSEKKVSVIVQHKGGCYPHGHGSNGAATQEPRVA